jgi:hypothetical protein
MDLMYFIIRSSWPTEVAEDFRDCGKYGRTILKWNSVRYIYSSLCSKEYSSRPWRYVSRLHICMASLAAKYAKSTQVYSCSCKQDISCTPRERACGTPCTLHSNLSSSKIRVYYQVPSPPPFPFPLHITRFPGFAVVSSLAILWKWCALLT